MLFTATMINYADRAALSIAGSSLSKDLHLDPVAMGYIFSAFAWSYVIGQLPGGWLLDRFGSKLVYGLSLIFWSLFTIGQGFIGHYFTATVAVIVLFTLRFLLGLAESPGMPADVRIVAAWFPASERGTATQFFNTSQYFATVIFAPIMGWITYAYGWQYVFIFMGSVGMLFAVPWFKVVCGPKEHPRVNQAELEYIERGGALINMDQQNQGVASAQQLPTWWCLKQLLASRMLMGVYIGQCCITTLTYFFLTWFPIYLVRGRGMSILKAGFAATVPALFGFCGGILGGMFSDYLIKRGYSLTFARKAPIVAGLLLSVSMIVCNYVQAPWLVVAIMALAFFGKGIGAQGFVVVADTSPKQIVGLSGGLFNVFSNIAGITTPIIIGYILRGTGSFNGALIFVGANALGAVLCYLLVVGEIKRLELKTLPQYQASAGGAR
jgi:ACS family glucarate transporter-like MFS transporter